MDDTNNHRDLKSIDGRDRSTPTSAKEASSERAKTIYAGLNQALQELADSGQPLFITPLGPPDSERITPVRWERIIFDVSADAPEAETKPKQGTTVVYAERVVVDSQKMIKILNVSGLLKGRDLPNEYIMGAPSFVDSIMPNTDVFIHPTNRFQYNCNVSYGDIMSLKDFGQMIKTMKEAAARLTKINKTAKLEKEHSGMFTVSI